MAELESPNPGNYVIGKATVYFTPSGGSRRHMGNCSAAEIEPTVEKLEHFSSMTGIKKKDKTVVIQVSAVVRITLEEFTVDNVRLALLGGEPDTDTEGNKSFEILAVSETRGRLEIIETNDVGPRFTYDLPSVAFTPAGPVALINEEWGTMELEGDVELVDGSSGTVTLQDSAVTETESA